jgi:UDP-glucuronate decarboxylase
MKTYLVTGGAGFLGSHLCERLLKSGDKVIVVDNLSSSTGANLVKLKYGWKRAFKFYDYDICYGLNALLEEHDIDGVFNLACPASPPFYQNMPIQTTLSCTLGVHNVLEFATLRKTRVLQTSTSEVYGDPTVHPQPETYRGNVNCFGPRACYDEGKRAAEALFFDYRKQNGTDIRVVRIFNTYGPHMLANDGRVVSNFINQALKGEDITIYGDGQQTRSFCYVDDLIDAMLVVWNSNYTSPVNIGNPGEYTMLELADAIIRITGNKSNLIYGSLPVDDPLQRCPDITLAKSLGWAGPTIDLDTGLQSAVQWFRELKNLTG